MSQIFTHVEGQGRPVVVLHGWGMNQQVWQPVRARLNARARVSWIDLPGHGHSHAMPLGDLAQVVAQVAPHIPAGAIVIGWSLGGLVAQALAQQLGSRISALLLVASTPRFVLGADWAHALPDETLTYFADNLQKDYDAAVKRFFALQFMGVRSDPKALNALRAQVLAYPASLQALDEGLHILRSADFTGQMVTQPTLWVLGRLDKLIPVSLAEGLTALGQTRVEIIQQAAHVPFVTHPDEFMQLVEAFLDEH